MPQLVVALAVVAAIAARPSRASAQVAAAPSELAAARVEVRLALSADAAQHMFEPRVRRLFEIELGDYADLARGTSGPLGDHVVYVWLDEPTPARLVIEVRAADRALSRRELNLSGMPSDVAARFAVVAAAEMVRAQSQPAPKPRRVAPPQRRFSPAELEVAARPLATLVGSASADALWLPTSHGGLAGPALSAGVRFRQVEEQLFGRALAGSSDAGATRLLEVGLGVSYRAWLGPKLRVLLGGEAALAAVHLGEATRVDGILGENDSWTGRAGAAVALELRLSRGAWLGLGAHPGALLRPVPFETPAASGFLRGAALGVSLALTLETAPMAPASP